MNIKKIKSNSFLIIMTLSTLVLLSAKGFAATDSSYSSYEDIVSELNSTRSRELGLYSDPLNQVKFHFGIGYVNSRLSLRLPNKLPNSAALNGVEARGGIDLLSPRWTAEAAVRSFQPETIKGMEFSLQEFEFLVSYNDFIAGALGFNLGAGMSSRYLDIAGNSTEQFDRSHTTPAWIMAGGLAAHFTRYFTVGIQLSYRSAMVNETADKGSIDGVISAAGHF